MARQQKQQTAGQQTKKTIRIPLAGNAQQRDTTSDKDQVFVNYMVETTKNAVTDTKKLFLVKRPGTVQHSYPAGVAGEGRGLWYFNNAVWSAVGDTLYKGTTNVLTLSTSTGMCGAVPFVNAADFSRQGLFLADGIDAWIIDSTDTVTRVDDTYLYWSSTTTIEEGDRYIPTAIGALYYVCTTAGITGASEPTWPTVIGNSVTDGTVVWRCEGTYSGPAKYTTGVKTVGMKVIPTSQNGCWYECIVAGTASGEPTWPTTALGDTVTDGTVTWEFKGEYGGFPTPHIPTPMFMDGYIFLPEANSLDIYSSGITFPRSWSALDFVGAESYPDPIVGLARQNNYIVAFGTNSTEFMYNAAKSNGLVEFDSPLDRQESLVLQVGSLYRNSLLQAERTIVFIGSSQLGGKSVWRMDGNNAKEISTEYIEKFLDLENSASNVTGFGIRIFGHMLYIINMPTANKTFVYDIEENIWTEWEYAGGMIPFVSFCEADGIILLQHKDNGIIYKLDPTVYNDFDADISARVRLAKQDFDTDSYKFFHQTVVIGDTPQHTDILRWSDDDYVTWSNDHVLQATDRPYFTRSGKARRRAWELEYTHNSPRRLEALEITYSIGDH